MEKLRDKGLYGTGLIDVRTPQMVERYNACLRGIGLEETRLERFQIDGIGWSPQIAEEKELFNYLEHDEANQFAIILTQEQKNSPVYSPTHSFDKALMAEVFRIAHEQIAYLTTSTAIWFDIDQQIDRYHSPLDLLMFESITVNPTTVHGLINAARKQRELVASFRSDNELWKCKDFRDELIQSAKDYGDLRFKPCIIPHIPFNQIRNFHTRAFGGVFVFRDLQVLSLTRQILILEDIEQHRNLIRSTDFVYGITDDQLFEKLEKLGLANADLSWYLNNPQELDAIKKNFIAETLYNSVDTEFDLANATDSQIKGIFAKYQDQFPPIYKVFEEFHKRIDNRALEGFKATIPLRNLLMRPNPNLVPEIQQLVWKLLLRMTPKRNLVALYRNDQQSFNCEYRSWPKQRQLWAIAHLKSYGISKTD